MVNFRKVYRIGTMQSIGGRWYSVYLEVEYKDGRLSICGTEGPTVGGNCIGATGQIIMDFDLSKLKPAPGWTHESIARVFAIWEEWHLNDMKAGKPEQEAAVKEWRAELKAAGVSTGGYSHVCSMLACRDLLVVDGYKYGSAWLKVEVPEEILQELANFPDTDRQPAWV